MNFIIKKEQEVLTDYFGKIIDCNMVYENEKRIYKIKNTIGTSLNEWLQLG